MDIFEERETLKPYEYPEVMKFVDTINHSYWLHSEVNFTSDIQDFKTILTSTQKEIIRKTLLAISQIEVKVKTFWGNLHHHLPKPEFNAVGACLAENEVRHERAYSHLLEVLGLNDDFSELFKVPVIKDRLNYLSKYLQKTNKGEDFVLGLTLFAIFIENVSLFSQFAIIMSFNRHHNLLKDTSNIVEWTSKEELIHGQVGIWLINQIRKEHKEWFTLEFYDKIFQAAEKSVEAESKIIDWILQDDKELINPEALKEFVKDRINQSLKDIKCKKLLNVDKELLKELNWFNEEIYSTSSVDFFYKRPTSYAKRTKTIDAESIF